MKDTAVMHDDMEVFDVGRDWAWHAFGWRGRPLGRLKNTCVASSMSKGKYLVVRMFSRFGELYDAVYIDASFNSLRSARH